jgi:hypothetical protein
MEMAVLCGRCLAKMLGLENLKLIGAGQDPESKDEKPEKCDPDPNLNPFRNYIIHSRSFYLATNYAA